MAISDEDQPIDWKTMRVRVNKARCKTCIFWTDGRSAVSPERAREVIDANLQTGACLTCHATIGTGSPAICAGYWSAYKDDVISGQIAQRVNGILYVSPPEGLL